jgi:hypothetical protein
MLHMVAMVFKYFSGVFASVSDMFHLFLCMLQLFYLDVSKADRVLHIGAREKRLAA